MANEKSVKVCLSKRKEDRGEEKRMESGDN